MPTAKPCFRTLADFVDRLESRNQLVRVKEPVSVTLELTEVHRRVLAARGPALLIERPLLADGSISDIPVLTNLFGTIDRVAQGMGAHPRDCGCSASDWPSSNSRRRRAACAMRSPNCRC